MKKVNTNNKFAFSNKGLFLDTVPEDEDDDDNSIFNEGLNENNNQNDEEEETGTDEIRQKLSRDPFAGSDAAKVAKKEKKIDSLKTKIVNDTNDDHNNAVIIEKNKSLSTTLALKKSIKEKHVAGVIRSMTFAQQVDLAFIIDATGSMGPHIANVKENICQIVEQVRSTHIDLYLRLAAVIYRDIDDEPEYKTFQFTSSVKNFKAFIGTIRAFGGFDVPEEMAIGIKKANSLEWLNPTRVVFIVSDAPCHGVEFHSFADNYPNGSPCFDIKSELKELSSKTLKDGTMSLYFGKVKNETDAMIKRFQEYHIPIDTVNFTDARTVTASVTHGVRRSIFRTMTTAADTGLASTASFDMVDGDVVAIANGEKPTNKVVLKEYNLDPIVLSNKEWRHQDMFDVRVFRNKPIETMDDLQAPLEIGMVQIDDTDKFFGSFFRRMNRSLSVSSSSGSSIQTATTRTRDTMYCRCAPSPFAEGEIRIAYYGQLAPKYRDLHDKKSAVIMKSFKHYGKGLNDRGQYLKQMEVSTIAHYLATQFNKSNQRPSHCPTIQFLQVCVVEDIDKLRSGYGGKQRFCVEPPLPAGGTPFTKYSNNTGVWSSDHIEETLLRFTKYTHEVTNGYLMVTDLQGCKKGNCFYLTDPVILCQDLLRFGQTNLGDSFMTKCMDSTTHYMRKNMWN